MSENVIVSFGSRSLGKRAAVERTDRSCADRRDRSCAACLAVG